MKKITVGTKAIKKLYEYPQMFNNSPRIIVSNNYMTNGYVLFTHDLLKNKGKLVATNDTENFFFDEQYVAQEGRIEKKFISRMCDDSIKTALVPQGQEISIRTMGVKKTRLLLRTDNFTLQVWHTRGEETPRFVFFDDYIMNYYDIMDEHLYGWSPERMFFDTQTQAFKIGLMPIKSDVLKVLQEDLKGQLNYLLDWVTNA